MVDSSLGASYRFSHGNRVDKRKRSSRGTTSNGWQVAEMNESHYEIVRRLLLGEKSVSIAKAMGCSTRQICNVKASPVVQDELALMRSRMNDGAISVAQELRAMAPIAIDRIREAIEEGTVLKQPLAASGILKEANNVIDRTEGKPLQRTDSRSLSVQLSIDDITRIKARAIEYSDEGSS